MRSGCKTYVMRDGKLVDVTEYVQAPPAPRVHIQDDRAYSDLWVPGFKYSDDPEKKGTPERIDLGSRTKHRQYMKERGLTHISDFDQPGGAWEQAAAKRERVAAGIDPENNRRITEAVAESLKKLEAGYRPPAPAPVEHDEHDLPVVVPKE